MHRLRQQLSEVRLNLATATRDHDPGMGDFEVKICAYEDVSNEAVARRTGHRASLLLVASQANICHIRDNRHFTRFARENLQFFPARSFRYAA